MASYLEDKLLEHCSGCGACKEICPKQCIKMQQKEDGFLFPIIDEGVCIHCDKCKRTCPYNEPVLKYKVQACFSGSTRDCSATESSSSGGVFYELSKYIIENGGIVSGARLDENNICIHSIAHNMNELQPLMGSKYVQSECSRVFPEIRKTLRSGLQVLFSGTPCQIAGLKNYLEKDYNNLYCIDIACHGVPSAADFRACMNYLENKHGGRLTYIKFRDKKHSGWYHSLTYTIEKNGRTETHTSMPYKIPYYYAFLWSKNIRKACYCCPYVGLERVGDITLADYWRAEKEYAEKQIGKGVSVILCNTECGIDLVKKCDSFGDFHEGKLEIVTEANQPFIEHAREYKGREQLLNNILTFGYRDTVTYIGKKKYFIESVKAVVPEKVKRFIRRALGAIER